MILPFFVEGKLLSGLSLTFSGLVYLGYRYVKFAKSKTDVYFKLSHCYGRFFLSIV